MNDLVELKTQSRALSSGVLNPANLHEALEMAGVLAKSTIIPKDFQNNPGNVLVAIQWGMELGLPPMQALQSIAVINGRPSLWGDAVIALCKSHPICEWITESFEGEGDALTAICATQRKGEPEPTIRSFSLADAKKAQLTGKGGPWTQYPKRMMQMRARSWCLRDAYPDLLRGMAVAEEERDRIVVAPDEAPAPPPATRTEAVKTRLKRTIDVTPDNARNVSTLHEALREGETLDPATGEIQPEPVAPVVVETAITEPDDPIADLLLAISECQDKTELERHREAVAALKNGLKRRAVDAWKAAEARFAAAA